MHSYVIYIYIDIGMKINNKESAINFCVNPFTRGQFFENEMPTHVG